MRDKVFKILIPLFMGDKSLDQPKLIFYKYAACLISNIERESKFLVCFAVAFKECLLSNENVHYLLQMLLPLINLHTLPFEYYQLRIWSTFEI